MNLSFITTFFGKFLSGVKTAEQLAEDFVKDLISNIVTNGGPVLILAASHAVAAAEAAGGSGADKLNAARKSVENDLRSQGIPIVVSAINAAIEAAVAQMNSANAIAADTAAAISVTTLPAESASDGVPVAAAA